MIKAESALSCATRQSQFCSASYYARMRDRHSSRKLAPEAVKVGNWSGRDIDKFAVFGLTAMPAERVAPPLLTDCFANFECKVSDTRLVSRYNLFILEVLKAWTDPAQKNPKTIHHQGDGKFVIDGKTIKLKSRMR